MTANGSRPAVPGERPGDPVPGGTLRRRVTEIPHEIEQWFRRHDGAYSQARELARAELTAKRDGYVFRWVHSWTCQLLEPGNEEKDIATADGVMLDGTPETDPRAREVEQHLLRTAGRDDPHGPGAVISWEQLSACQLLEPDGKTVIDESDGWAVIYSETCPTARLIAAQLAVEAGI